MDHDRNSTAFQIVPNMMISDIYIARLYHMFCNITLRYSVLERADSLE